MTSPSITSPRRSIDLPKPEEGLAEWTSKIRALQQQVDADEEAEHRRLQEEIAASRLARQRRSRGAGYGNESRTNSVDFADTSRQIKLADEREKDMKPEADRQQGQEDAMRKLTGNTNPSSNTSNSGVSSRVTSPTPSTRPEPMSLAQFMGGRGSGPRLKKHAPQQDAHDPTQFEQRTKVTSPHPVFGRGGIAMPGMVKQPSMPSLRSQASSSSLGAVSDQPQRAGTPSWKKDSETRSRSPADISRTSSSPFAGSPSSSVATRYTDNIPTQRPLSPQKSGSRDRDRTMSSPSKPFPERSPVKSTPFEDKKPAASGRVSPQKTGNRERTLSTPGRASPTKGVSFAVPTSDKETSDPYKKKRASFGGVTRPKTPTQDSSSPKSHSPQKPVEVPSLARTIRPQPRSPPNTPQVSLSLGPSAAFLRPPIAKEPTPSLSRLQGRGFVQNMVKASHNLEGASPMQTTPERAQSGGRKSSVFERWQPQSTPSPPPAVSPKPSAMRKSWTTEPPLINVSPDPRVAKPSRSATGTTFPTSKDNEEKKDVKGLGSATTLVVFKPAEIETTEFADVDELGMKPRYSSNLSELPAHTGKPLIHPTRDRAKKPKKTTSATPSSKSEDREQVQQQQLQSQPQPQPTRGDLPSWTRRKEREQEEKPIVVDEAPKEQKRVTPPQSGRITDRWPEEEEKEKSLSVNRKPSPQITPPSSNGARTGRVTDRWSDQPIIGVKPVLSRENSQSTTTTTAGSGMVGRKALPGLAATGPSYPSTFGVNRPVSKSPEVTSSGPSSPAPVAEVANRVVTPVRHSRIPSTGNRATVMEVAQAFDQEPEQPTISSPVEMEPAPDPQTKEVEPEVLKVEEDESQRLPTPAPSVMERRRSTYDKYVVPSLPPLKEEATPLPTPVGTLSRPEPELQRSLQGVFDETPPEPKALPVESQEPANPLVKASRIIHLSHVDHPLPTVDYQALMKTRRTSLRKSTSTTISVEVMNIIGNTATPLSGDLNVFYDNEILAIVYRSKSVSGGLVSTTVWGWFGRNSQSGERERQKLEELAKRYGTSLISVKQYHEPAELMDVLGKQLSIRQGARAHWSAENTTLHRVRSKRGNIFIDELEIDIKNLCSGFTCCLSLLDTVYVWYGRGSTAPERTAALQYGKTLSNNIVELTQGVNDEEEMFWIVFGEGSYAAANYWQWRDESPESETHIWRIDASNTKTPVTAIDSLETEDAQNFVHVLDCVWEYFVMVGRSARGKRADIRLGLAVATELSIRVRHQRPYTPTIHTIVFPSQVPIDLSAHFRELDEAVLNDNNIPDHMNILTKEDALDHLRRKSWEEFSLRDASMLPLGMNTDALS